MQFNMYVKIFNCYKTYILKESDILLSDIFIPSISSIHLHKKHKCKTSRRDKTRKQMSTGVFDIRIINDNMRKLSVTHLRVLLWDSLMRH